MARSRHPNKDIEKAIRYAEESGWWVKESIGRGHAWGSLYCPDNNAECRCGEFCIASIWSTPKNPDSHARKIKQVVDHCVMHKNQQEIAAGLAKNQAVSVDTE